MCSPLERNEMQDIHRFLFFSWTIILKGHVNISQKLMFWENISVSCRGYNFFSSYCLLSMRENPVKDIQVNALLRINKAVQSCFSSSSSFYDCFISPRCYKKGPNSCFLQAGLLSIHCLNISQGQIFGEREMYSLSTRGSCTVKIYFHDLLSQLLTICQINLDN